MQKAAKIDILIARSDAVNNIFSLQPGTKYLQP